MKRMLTGLILAGTMLTGSATADAAVRIVKPRPKPRVVIVKPKPKPRKVFFRPKPKRRSLINIDIDF